MKTVFLMVMAMLCFFAMPAFAQDSSQTCDGDPQCLNPAPPILPTDVQMYTQCDFSGQCFGAQEASDYWYTRGNFDAPAMMIDYVNVINLFGGDGLGQGVSDWLLNYYGNNPPIQ
jgi:curli biogenesis system outer membrane secretion channel CsgG